MQQRGEKKKRALRPKMHILIPKTTRREAKAVIKSKSMRSGWCYAAKQAASRATVLPVLESSHLNRDEAGVQFTTASVSAHYLSLHKVSGRNEPMFELPVF